MRNIKKIRLLLLVVLLFICLVLTKTAWALPNIPLGHEAYSSLNRLAALGIIDDLMMTSKPMDRTRVLQSILSIKETELNALNDVEKQIAQIEISRLKYYFTKEFNQLQNANARGVLYSFADPFTIFSSYTDINNTSTGMLSKLDNTNGRLVDNQLSFEWKDTAWFALSDSIGFYGELWERQQQYRDSKTIKPNIIYLFMKLGNLRFEVGKLSLWWGGAAHGNLILTNNIQPLNTIRLFNVKPIAFPKKIHFKIDTFLSKLEKRRVHSKVRLFGLRATLNFANALEVGLSRVTMFGGKGIPGLSGYEFLKLYFSDPNQGGKFDVNELGSIDFLLHSRRILNVGPDIYGELGGEDEAGFRPTKLGYVLGVYWPSISFVPSSDFRIEFASNHVDGFPNIWYNHGVYNTGYSFKGDIIGHHMGSDARDIYAAYSLLLNKLFKLTLSIDFEKHNLAKSVKTSKYEYSIGFLKNMITPRATLKLDYIYKIIKNPEENEGLIDRGHLILTLLSFAY